MKFDFSGYATKNDLKCTDGRTIRKDAFKSNDGQKVPLVYQHLHNDPSNVLGHALLENREDGVYAYCSFNGTDSGKRAKELVEHGDITFLSIYANKLVQKGTDVIHGAIREVSLVLSGANPGAVIDNLAIQHSDGEVVADETEAFITTGVELSLEQIEHAAGPDDETIEDVIATMTDKQKDVLYALVARLVDGGGEPEDAKHSDEEKKTEDIKHSDEGGSDMKKNVFDGDKEEKKQEKNTLTHAEIKVIFDDAKRLGSLKESFLVHAGTYGIDNISVLFPDAQTVTPAPDFIKRDMEWVPGVIGGTRHTPFSRVKSATADITVETARAKGYVTGALKTEEVFALLSRVTYPTTIYKKQKLDRDDIIDITDLDVVSWLKAEMRMMLDEELARAVLVGDGRMVGDPDKVDELCIRPIYKDADTYAHRIDILKAATTEEIIETILRSSQYYKGAGSPAFYTTTTTLIDMLLIKDISGRRIYNSEAELASAMRVSRIIEVPVMSGLTRVDGQTTWNLLGIVTNLKDYVMGADKGGQVSMFDDFDIDYNQYKYLMETRCSGALVHPKSALIIEQRTA